MASRTAFRLLATATIVGAALLSGIIIARRLGAAEKAVVSTLSFLIALGVPVAGWGLGEAGVTLIRGRGRSLGAALRTTLAVVLVSSVFVAGVLALIAFLVFSGTSVDSRNAVIAACVALPAAALATSLAQLLEAQERTFLTSASRALAGVVIAGMTAVLVLGLGWGAVGGVVAIAVGWAAAVVMLLISAHRDQLPTMPSIDRGFLKEGLTVGVPLQIGALLVVASSRLDLLVVAAISGARPAGLYSVSLTVGNMVVYASGALLVAAQPRIASLQGAAALKEVERFARAAIALSIIAAALFAVMVPLAIPLAFGYGFRDSVPSAMILLVAGVFQSVHGALARTAAPLGHTRVVARSHGAALAALLLADLILIPPFGIVGAASAGVLAAGVGVAVAWSHHARTWPGAKVRNLTPGRNDVRTIAESVRGLARSATPGGK